ncbi:hypothetical protein FIBSPDRAFT_749589 [Athelia psychrophila]|uniref:Transposase Tc1-like domain-containing protein n=1 Tax=Athelia psychrophila TaxID=1759441 RepID=A0A166EJX2_9AGAM|nr:hypothetical protein FIBSPDRAFT_749589 [Fibularhizoctonia sp. CBS 109695]
MAYGNRRHILEVVKKQMVTLSARYTVTEVAKILDVAPRTVRQALQLWRRTDKVVNKPVAAGRPRVLTSLNVAYPEGCIEHTPDIYLSKLQHNPVEACGIEVDWSTIQHSLNRRGFIQKKVSVTSSLRDKLQAQSNML